MSVKFGPLGLALVALWSAVPCAAEPVSVQVGPLHDVRITFPGVPEAGVQQTGAGKIASQTLSTNNALFALYDLPMEVTNPYNRLSIVDQLRDGFVRSFGAKILTDELVGDERDIEWLEYPQRNYFLERSDGTKGRMVLGYTGVSYYAAVVFYSANEKPDSVDRFINSLVADKLVRDSQGKLVVRKQ